MRNTFSPHPLWWLCLAVRIGIVIWVSVPAGKLRYKNLTALSLLIMSVGFMVKFVTSSNNEVQIRRVFWHNVRWVHSVFFGLAAVIHFTGNEDDTVSIISKSGIILIMDVLFSIVYRMYNVI